MKAKIKNGLFFLILFRHGFIKQGNCYRKNATFYQRTIHVKKENQTTTYTGVGRFGPSKTTHNASIRDFNRFVRGLKSDGQYDAWHMWND